MPANSPSKLRRNAAILTLVFLFPVLILSALFLFRRSSLQRSAADPAIFDAQSSPAMANLIGVPMLPGWPIHGTLRSAHGSGFATLQIPIAGPRGKGTLLESARQQSKHWQVCFLVFHPQAGPDLPLIAAPNAGCQPQP